MNANSFKKETKGLTILVDAEWVDAALWFNVGKGDQEARCKAFDQYIDFAHKLAGQYFYTRKSANCDRKDYEQWAAEALLECIDRFDPYRNIPFTAYARIRIRGRMADGVAAMSEVSRQKQQYRLLEKERLASFKHDEQQEMSALDQLREVAVGLALGLVIESDKFNNMASDKSQASNGYDSLEWKMLCLDIDAAIDTLPPPEPFIINQHYRNDVSFSQIAKLLKLSNGRISQLHRKALGRLKKRVNKL
jgi:RNA polymerase sigma factor for flagellar operon FliA